ncbi:MAG: Sec-independent protein translocase protein TatB [Arcobacteraceae bacterium]|nr:Sec-independent protein translocase protein TatB [Arcobacteraceae bacterium]MDY0328446.1 Sec-independent protein translocase protein TatB [Arcobacteraceae bacterium]
MFGMGLLEISVIAIVAIIALGPEKLPGAMVDIAKFFKKLKGGIEDAKSTLDNELKISELKAEAQKYKSQVENIQNSVSVENILNDPLTSDDKPKTVQSEEKTDQSTPNIQEPIRQKVSFNNKKTNQDSENV